MLPAQLSALTIHGRTQLRSSQSRGSLVGTIRYVEPLAVQASVAPSGELNKVVLLHINFGGFRVKFATGLKLEA